MNIDDYKIDELMAVGAEAVAAKSAERQLHELSRFLRSDVPAGGETAFVLRDRIEIARRTAEKLVVETTKRYSELHPIGLPPSTEAPRVRPDGPETAEGGLIGQQPY